VFLFSVVLWVSHRHPSIPEWGPVLVSIAAAVALLLFHVLTAHERRGVAAQWI